VKLVAMMMVGAGELERYLNVTVPALLEHCDEVTVRCEGDAEISYLENLDDQRVHAFQAEPSFFGDEGTSRNELLAWTMQRVDAGDWILSIDADELVTDGQRLRQACETQCPIVTLDMQECWRVTDDGLAIREDGGWHAHAVPICFRVPDRLDNEWRIRDKQLACGREPLAVQSLHRQHCSEPSGADIIHLGWSNRAERQQRYQRYAVNDGGRFHANQHLRSIMWDDHQVRLRERAWPESWSPVLRAGLVERANRG
jgi:hypothetical protein